MLPSSTKVLGEKAILKFKYVLHERPGGHDYSFTSDAPIAGFRCAQLANERINLVKNPG